MSRFSQILIMGLGINSTTQKFRELCPMNIPRLQAIPGLDFTRVGNTWESALTAVYRHTKRRGSHSLTGSAKICDRYIWRAIVPGR